MTNRPEDKTLIRGVYSELYSGKGGEDRARYVSAGLTRYGGLVVLVYDGSDCDADVIWQGENILAARAYVDSLQ